MARLARAAVASRLPWASAPTVAPAPSSSLDSKAPFEAPVFKEIGRQNTLATWHSIYDEMLDYFKLSPEQRKRFYELHNSNGVSPDSEEELRKMFGENKKIFQAYVSYADTEHERSMLLQFQQQTDKSLQISDRQYRRSGETLL